MTSKKKSQYEEVIDHVLDLVEVVGRKRPKPKTIISDFEHAILNTISSRFPDSKIKGCWFYFPQVKLNSVSKYF